MTTNPPAGATARGRIAPVAPTGSPSPGAAAPAPRGRTAGSRGWGAAASRWAPGVVAGGFPVAVLAHYGVSARDLASFCAYLAVCVAVPGTLLARAAYRARRSLPEDLALGLTIGYAAEVLAYIAARAAGAPLLVLAWPAAVYAAFLLVPRLRPFWRARPRPAVAAWERWFAAGTVVYLTAWSAFICFRVVAPAWPEAGWAHADLPFHLSLAGELRHHVPPQVPFVAGEPLNYHWFAYAHLAASSWITGVEPLTLLTRLSVLPMLVAFAVLVGLTGRRVAGSAAAGAMAVAGTLLVAAPSLYANANGLLRWTGVLHVPWNSPTQTFGALLFAPVMLLLADLLVRPGGGRARWALLALLLVAVMGAKAPYLPLLAAALALVTAVEAVRLRRLPRAALAALGMTAGTLAFAQVVLFGGARLGMTVEPLSVVRATWAELAGRPAATGLVAGFALVFLTCWGVTWCGALGLLARPPLLLRPGVTLMAGLSAAGAGLMLLLGSEGDLNQGYFLQSCYPYLAVLAVYGLVTAVRAGRPGMRAIIVACLAGVAAATLVRVACGVQVPLPPGERSVGPFLPFAVLLLFIGAASLVAASMSGPRRAAARALLIVAVSAAGVPAAWQARVLDHLGHGADSNLNAGDHPVPEQIPRGAMAAARWLRGHAGPGDVVATNAHCLWGHERPCDSRHFWVSAMTERRVLVEGWAYTAANLDRSGRDLPFTERPFWDAARLRANDAVFEAPSARGVEALRERYGVRWLVADERLLGRPEMVGRFASFQARYGDYAVYRLPDPARGPMASGEPS
ncbi:hypothetical protein Ssi03_12280 [Sphaerisporangium siamense]|uniref:Uncharacterized protein n=1 Tax=Sphaerisporangium siamense TaxID=795645 RepID=A0A7W7GBM9_9ACTN|nr:hypothetical protein [Sphaerisporangium siamense]MBB4703000.1 hypothetical protein [Sphaerisporangium siamense]GII83238.1 hypothetical protein Ssi03_12280 [Sphaerisporangium siamense]